MSQKNDKTIAQSIEEFEALIAWFNSEEFSLEEALSKYQSAHQLADEIDKRLHEIKNEVVLLKKKFDA